MSGTNDKNNDTEIVFGPGARVTSFGGTTPEAMAACAHYRASLAPAQIPQQPYRGI